MRTVSVVKIRSVVLDRDNYFVENGLRDPSNSSSIPYAIIGQFVSSEPLKIEGTEIRVWLSVFN